MKKLLGILFLFIVLTVFLTACGVMPYFVGTENSAGSTTETITHNFENDETIATEDTVEPANTDVMTGSVNTTYVSLQQIGSFEDKGSLSLSNQQPLYEFRSEEGVSEYRFYSDMGENLLDKWYRKYKYLGEGVTIVYEAGLEYLLCGLVNINTGDVLLNCEAAMIEQISDRFYYVIYTTEKTENRNECFVYLTSAMVSLSPDDDDVMYKGYGTIFDAQEGKLLDKIKIKEPGTEVLACGNSICVETNYNDYDVYSSDGNLIGHVTDAQIGDGFILVQTGSVVTVFDPALNEIGTLSDGEVLNGGGSNYISFSDKDRMRGIMDIKGNVILEPQFQYIREIQDDLVLASKSDKYGITKLDGTEICEYKYESIYTRVDGAVYELRDENGQEYVLLAGMEPILVTELKNAGLAYYSQPDALDSSAGEFILYSDGGTIKLHNASLVGDGLLVYADEGVVELIGGEVLLDNKYDKVYLTNGYLYALKNGTWIIFDLVFHFEG